MNEHLVSDSVNESHDAAAIQTEHSGGVQAEIRWALMALGLVRNRLTAMGIKAEDENGTALINLDAAIATLEGAL